MPSTSYPHNKKLMLVVTLTVMAAALAPGSGGSANQNKTSGGTNNTINTTASTVKTTNSTATEK